MYIGENRPLPLILLFSILSLGFFNFYWVYFVCYELKQVTGDEDIKPVFEAVISILTLGIYLIFWSYKYGKILLQAQKDHEVTAKDYSFLYAVLTGVLLFPVTMMLMQRQLNNLWKFGK